MIDIHDLDKAEVLAVLYNASHPLGMGVNFDPAPMTKSEATSFLTAQTYFNYLKSRVMKVNLKGDEFDPRLYDRDNGQGAAQRVIDALRAK